MTLRLRSLLGLAIRRLDVLWLVRAEGVEPPRLASPEPKSGASTSSATPATAMPSRRPTGVPRQSRAGLYSKGRGAAQHKFAARPSPSFASARFPLERNRLSDKKSRQIKKLER